MYQAWRRINFFFLNEAFFPSVSALLTAKGPIACTFITFVYFLS